MIHIFTVAARNYLSLALALGDSVARHHPEAQFTIYVADGLDQIEGMLPGALHAGHRLLPVINLFPREQFEDLAFKYNIIEFCTAIKPMIFKTLFSDPSVEIVYYLDPDTYLYHRLDPITASTPGKSLYLSPHLIDCRLADDHPYPEFRHLWEGIFNLGFCAIRRTQAAVGILDWWDARLHDYCFADHADGLHTDQKWMDYAPVFFREELQIVHHYGANVAHWNLGERPIVIQDGSYLAGPDVLIFFHFSGFNFYRDSLTKHTPVHHQGTYTNQALLGLAQQYRESVIRKGHDRFHAVPYAFAKYDDGTPVTELHRRLYRVRSKTTSFTSPFSASGRFYEELDTAGLLDRSAEATANYSKETVRNFELKMRAIERVLRLILKVIGVRRYVQLVKLAGWLGRFEHHEFLVDK